MAKRRKKGGMNCKIDVKSCKESCGGGYFLGFLGAAVYYISTATSFWTGVVGFLKAIVWPAFLVFDALKFFAA